MAIVKPMALRRETESRYERDEQGGGCRPAGVDRVDSAVYGGRVAERGVAVGVVANDFDDEL
jgi:hypothetical protein